MGEPIELASGDPEVLSKRESRKKSIRYHIKKEDLKLFWRTYAQAADDMTVVRQQCYDVFTVDGVDYIKSEKMSLRAARMSRGIIKTYAFFVVKD